MTSEYRKGLILITGRVAIHTRQADGTILATPAPGPHGFTPAEHEHYLQQRERMRAQNIGIPVYSD